MQKNKRSRDYIYSFLPGQEPGDGSAADGASRCGTRSNQQPRRTILHFAVGAALIFGALLFIIGQNQAISRCTHRAACSGLLGTWGQLSPWAPVPSKIDPAIPPQCEVTFAQVLARHGSRGPTADKGARYAALVDELHDNVTEYTEGLQFVKDYQYTLVPDILSSYGQQEMANAGRLFYQRYKNLALGKEPFVRSSGSERVVMSARNFTRGYYEAQGRDSDEFASRILVIPESKGHNNTLDHGSCERFENGPGKDEGSDKLEAWKSFWVPSVQRRLNKKLPGAKFNMNSTVSFMELCPFETVSTPELLLSDFCRIFSDNEWRNYDYYQSLDKWYTYGPGRDLAASQGVGFVNELLARLTGKRVEDHTSTNKTLDASPETFPLDRTLYVDLSHDNSMMTVFTALRLFEGIGDLPATRRLPPEQLDGFSASLVVPFGTRMYVEKMRCSDERDTEEGLVRILVNDRVVPLRGCGADKLGRCKLDKFVKSMSFARSGGEWDRCSM